jgi:hypothetical protein
MKSWSSWFNDLMPSLPGCGTDIATHELRRAAQEFFGRSRAWRVVLDAISVGINEAEIEILPDETQQFIVRVESSAWEGQPLAVKTVEEIESKYGGDWMDQTGTPDTITQMQHGTVRLMPSPVVAGVLRCRVTVKPSDSASGIPDAQAYQYRDAIADGAKARLMLMPKKPWTNPELGGVASGMFEAAITSAASASARAFGRGRIEAKPSWC